MNVYFMLRMQYLYYSVNIVSISLKTVVFLIDLCYSVNNDYDWIMKWV